MARIYILFAIAFGSLIAIATGLSQHREIDIVIVTDYPANDFVYVFPACEIDYVAEETGEVINEFVEVNQVEEPLEGFTTEVFHPPKFG